MKRRTYLLLFALLLNLLLYLQPRPAYACQCRFENTPEAAYERANAVFTGEVTAIVKPQVIPGWMEGADRLAERWSSSVPYELFYNVYYTVKVTESWKGVTTNYVSLTSDVTPCSINFRLSGEESLFYVVRYNGKLYPDPCSRINSTSAARSDLTYLRNHHPSLPLAPTLPWYSFGGLALFAILAVTGIGWHTWRKRKGKASS